MIALLSKLPCRTEWGLWFPYEHYVIDSCARCYHYMPESAFKPGLKYSYVPYLYLYHEALNSTFLGNDTYNLLFTFGSVALFNKWRQCCNEAIICCANYHKQYPGLHKAVPLESMEFSAPVADIDSSSGGGGSGGGQLKWWQVANESAPVDLCPPTWDGWLCWDEFARPSQVLEQSCPKHIYWHQLVPPCRGYVTKKCNESGQWFQNKEHKEWSNYTMCARDDIYARRIEYSLVTNIISMCALIPALIIFTYYKQLSSMSRIRLHKHLFTSLLLHAIISALLKWHLLKSTHNRSASDDRSEFSRVHGYAGCSPYRQCQ
ncbi:hypothetical protein TYRP_001354 [Tyrophagus putrescentiae]|nr:hypothetical protein TYRP_001354 [Tyrophagus putrescentiae]